MKMVTIFWRK